MMTFKFFILFAISYWRRFFFFIAKVGLFYRLTFFLIASFFLSIFLRASRIEIVSRETDRKLICNFSSFTRNKQQHHYICEPFALASRYQECRLTT